MKFWVAEISREVNGATETGTAQCWAATAHEAGLKFRETLGPDVKIVTFDERSTKVHVEFIQ